MKAHARAGALVVACAAALATGGAASAASGTPAERPPTRLWSEFPLVPPPPPAASGVAGVRAEARRPAAVPAQIEFPDDASAVPGSLLLALLMGNALFLGGIAIMLIRARGRRLATAGAVRPAAARPSVPRPQRTVLAPSAVSSGIETCEIAFRTGDTGSRFYARPVGGAASPGLPLAFSPPFASAETEDARQALEELVRALEAAGWQPSGRGEEWFELRFRRR